MHVAIRLQGAEGADATQLSPAEVERQAVDCLRMCLRAYGGQFDPSAINHRYVGLNPGDPRIYDRLKCLLEPGTLRRSIEDHPV